VADGRGRPQDLVPVSNTFAAATPNILAILANQTVTAQTITGAGANLHDALGGGATLAAETDQLLDAIEQPFTVLAADSGPFLQDISQNPQEISQLLSGLEHLGPVLAGRRGVRPVPLPHCQRVRDKPADLGLAVLGGPSVASYLTEGLGASYVNPPTYTSADCPSFGSLSGCGGTTTVSATTPPRAPRPPPSHRDFGPASAPVLAEPAQTQAVGQIVAAATGPASPPTRR
jgi:hypothetical protein